MAENQRLQFTPEIQILINEIRESKETQKNTNYIVNEIHKQVMNDDKRIALTQQDIRFTKEKLDSHMKEHKWHFHAITKTIISFIFGGGLIAFILKILTQEY